MGAERSVPPHTIRERAEIVRSDVEAANTSTETIKVGRKRLRRYAILHHLDLDTVSREVHRVLRRGGRAIFQEPVRNSKWVERLRTVVPYQADDVSPFERPLTDAELQNFARHFVVRRQRVLASAHQPVERVANPETSPPQNAHHRRRAAAPLQPPRAAGRGEGVRDRKSLAPTDITWMCA